MSGSSPASRPNPPSSTPNPQQMGRPATSLKQPAPVRPASTKRPLTATSAPASGISNPSTPVTAGKHPPGAASGNNSSHATPTKGGVPMQRLGTGNSSFLGTPGTSSIGFKSTPSGHAHKTVGHKHALSSASSGHGTQAPAMEKLQSSTGSGAAFMPSPAPSGFNGLEGAGGVPMSLSLSNLGLTQMGFSASQGAGTGTAGGIGMAMGTSAMGHKFLDDAERRRRLEAVLEILGRRPGRISREGLERLGKRAELDVMWEGKDRLILAGKNAVVIDIEFLPETELVKNVEIALMNASDAMNALTPAAVRILKNDLTPPPGVAHMNAKLDRFANNLDRLARLDKLCTSDVNCFEAVFGIYTSLKRLYDADRKTATDLIGAEDPDVEAKADHEIACKQSGRPVMHGGDTVGLSIFYWTDRPAVRRGRKRKAQHMEDDKDVKMSDARAYEDDSLKPYHFLTIECESYPPALYPSIRKSSDWIRPDVYRVGPNATDPLLGDTDTPIKVEDIDNDLSTAAGPTDLTTSTDAAMADNLDGSADSKPQNSTTMLEIAWTDPPGPVTLITDPSNLEQSEAQAQELAKQPQARFIFKLSTPLVLPRIVAQQVFASVGVDITHEMLDVNDTWDRVLLRNTNLAGKIVEADDGQRSIHTTRSFAPRPGSGGHRKSSTLGLYLMRPSRFNAEAYAAGDLAVEVTTIPFVHPRQVLVLLPVLRQWTAVQTLIRKTFAVKKDTQPPQPKPKSTPLRGSASLDSDFEDTPASWAAMLAGSVDNGPSLEDLLQPAAAGAQEKHALDVSLQLLPVPRVTAVVTGAKGRGGAGVGAVTFEVQQNAEIVLVSYDLVDGQSGDPRDQTGVHGMLLEALRGTWDLGIWAEWVRGMFGG